jgi:regulator of telomere elongation helicase 1
MKWECNFLNSWPSSTNAGSYSPFPNRLENPHVISSSQVSICVVPKGPSGHKLSSSYENRSSTNYVTDMGNAIISFCSVIPDGVLVFFPSYGVMQQCIDSWKRQVSNFTAHL